MSAVASFFVYAVDWRIWAALAVLALIGGWFLAARFLGVKAANQIVAAAGSFFAALLYVRRARQRGWDDAHEQGKKDADAAIDRARSARLDAVRRDADPERLREDDGFRRD